MAKITTGNRLYIYQLLSREVGAGKQTLLANVEDVLAADGIAPEDLDCESVQELLGELPEFVKITTFKRGNVYATVLRNAEFDAILERAAKQAEASKQATPAKKSGKGGRPWKAKGSKKDPVPAKPRHKQRPPKAEEPVASAATESETTEAVSSPIVDAKAKKNVIPTTDASPHEGVTEASEPDVAAEGSQSKDAEGDATVQAAPASTARTLAEILAESRAEEAAKAAAEAGAKSQEAEPSHDTPMPKGDHTKQEEAPAAGAPEGDAARDLEELRQTLEEKLARLEALEASMTAASGVAAKAEDSVAPVTEEAPAEDVPAAPAPEPTVHLNITYDPYAEMEAELSRQAEEAARQVEAERAAKAAEPQPRPVAPKPDPEASVPMGLQADLPQHFSTDVLAKDEVLSLLYQVLPFDADPMTILDEDWRVARSTGTLGGTRSKITFPLRYLREDGVTHMDATLRRQGRSASGKRWVLAYVNGDDGTGTAHAAAGMEGAPQGDQGGWSDLSPTMPSDAVSPVRELAQFAHIGSWDAFLGTLATMAQPERWSYPGEGVGKGSRYGILRDYVTVTFHRVREEGKLLVSPDGQFAAFNTGLLTPFLQDVHACFVPNRGDIPWRFEGFCVAGSGELGARLAASLYPLPEPATYLTELAQVRLEPSRLVVLDVDAILTRQLGRLPKAFLEEQLATNHDATDELGRALESGDFRDLARTLKGDPGLYRRLGRSLSDAVDLARQKARASYRVLAPAFDPRTESTVALLPLSLVDDGHVDCALALVRQPSGNYQGVSILSLARAYSCARIVSQEQPAWLDPAQVI